MDLGCEPEIRADQGQVLGLAPGQQTLRILVAEDNLESQQL
ncbi:hypothetical protein AM1_2667 [Acaryochloris marina MBIC11017]|uniref:Uncharacterized protein n=2 Tax=Acaryochloris marina TaxID=155978 RepID=B0C7Z0_ACAM1|nr:hypothetical protein AM1_2667 [Acaryochloris marina MBIC11017]